MKKFYKHSRYLISILALLFCICISQNVNAQDTVKWTSLDTIKVDLYENLETEEFTIVDTLESGQLLVIQWRDPNPKDIRPDNVPDHRRRKIIEAHRNAKIQLARLNVKLDPIWEKSGRRKRKKRLNAWNNHDYLTTMFGDGKSYRSINKVRKSAIKHRAFLYTQDFIYYDKDKYFKGTDKKTVCTSFPGPPSRINIYLPFWEDEHTPAYLGGTFHHEMIHERRIGGHPSRKYKTDSNTYFDAALELAEKKPRRAKRAPHVWGWTMRDLAGVKADSTMIFREE
jgi:hypothetical protein